MEYVEKDNNIERTYSVSFNRYDLTTLLDDLIKNVNYKTEGTHTFYSGEIKIDLDERKAISGDKFPNGTSCFERIDRVYRCTSSGPYSYHGDSVAIEGVKITIPKLAYLIDDLFNNREDSVDSIIKYAESDELIPIDERICSANDKVDSIDNFEFDKKIRALNELRELCQKKKNHEYFDTELLKEYYLKALSIIELKQTSEKVTKSGIKVALKDHAIPKK